MRQGTATALCSHLIHGQVSAAVCLFSWEKQLCVPSPFHSGAGIAAGAWEGVGQPQPCPGNSALLPGRAEPPSLTQPKATIKSFNGLNL